jgi:peptidoglycan/xylan/chitin deacetylase (PgdA/CDA1 family)
MLSFDVEEFDLPNEFGAEIPLERQLEIGASGLDAAIKLIDELEIRVTLFTTARMADYVRDQMPGIAQRHEIASHGVRHDRFEPSHYAESKKRLEELAHTEVTGFRMARLQPVDVPALIESGYRYDSSENPIRLPGRYDNRHLPRTPRMDHGLVRLPISTSPRLRIPLFWLGFRHLPAPLLKRTLDRTLEHDGHLNLFLHPWELLDTREWRNHMPRVVRHGGGTRLAARLAKTIRRLSEKARFTSMSEFSSDFSDMRGHEKT